MALATLFVTMPFVVRELLPILDDMDMAEEEAARSLGESTLGAAYPPASWATSSHPASAVAAPAGEGHGARHRRLPCPRPPQAQTAGRCFGT
jgi:hypothetical protein